MDTNIRAHLGLIFGVILWIAALVAISINVAHSDDKGDQNEQQNNTSRYWPTYFRDQFWIRPAVLSIFLSGIAFAFSSYAIGFFLLCLAAVLFYAVEKK